MRKVGSACKSASSASANRGIRPTPPTARGSKTRKLGSWSRHAGSRHGKTPSRVRFRPPPPGTFRISPCGIQRTALRNGFNLVASRTRCDRNATRAEATDQGVGPREFAKSVRFVLAHEEYRLEPRARLWAGERDVDGLLTLSDIVVPRAHGGLLGQSLEAADAGL